MPTTTPAPDGSAWTVARTGTFVSADRHTLNVLAPTAGASGVRYARLTLLTSQGGAGASFRDLSEFAVYGTPTKMPVAPQFPIVEADVVGEQVADAVEAGRFLILTTPEVADDLRAQGEDMDAYIEQVIKDYT